MNKQQRWNVAIALTVWAVLACCFEPATGVPGPVTGAAYGAEADESLGVPDALVGFRGMLIGVVEQKGEQEFVIKVVKITRTWKANQAKNPQAAVGKKAVCELWPEGRLYERHRRTLAGLQSGDRVLVEPFHRQPDHDHLTVVEEFKKIAAEQDAAESAKKPAPAALGVPAALQGFRGMLVATIVKKGTDELIIKIEKIDRTWKGNKAKKPGAAIGQQAVCELWKKGRLYQTQRSTLAELKPGDRVLLEPFHLEPNHDHLTVVEELRKVD